jgi:hypothetical protein
MADLPELPQRIVRLFALRWKDLIEKHGFTGGHLEWHQSKAKRSLAAYRPISFALPPLGSKVTYYGRQGEPISHEEWVRHRKEDHVTRQSDPAVIDSIGIAETIALAKERFEGCAGDYLPVWSSAADLDSDKFHESLERLQQSVGREISDLWRNGDWHTAWFERTCRSKVADVLKLLVKEWGQKALKLEIERLECRKEPIAAFDSASFNATMTETQRVLDFSAAIRQGSQSYQDALAKFKKNQQDGLAKKQPVPVAKPAPQFQAPDEGALPAPGLPKAPQPDGKPPEQNSPAGTGEIDSIEADHPPLTAGPDLASQPGPNSAVLSLKEPEAKQVPADPPLKDLAGGNRLFRKSGDVWALAFGGKKVHVRNSKGMGYIADLLRSPDQDIHSLQLLMAGAGKQEIPFLGSGGETLDQTAFSKYKTRANDLQQQLAEAQLYHDLGRKEDIQAELERLAEQIVTATGLGGRHRNTQDDAEKIRKGVANAIQRAIVAIKEHDPVLADHLKLRIKRGLFVTYQGDGLEWQF